MFRCLRSARCPRGRRQFLPQLLGEEDQEFLFLSGRKGFHGGFDLGERAHAGRMHAPTTVVNAHRCRARTDSAPQTPPPWAMQLPSLLRYQTEFGNEGFKTMETPFKAKNAIEEALVDLIHRRSSDILGKIDQPTRDDIYIISLRVENNPGPKVLEVELGYSTLSRWRSCSPASGQQAHLPTASSSDEAKWAYGFGDFSSEKTAFGRDDPHDWQLLAQWLQSLGFYYTDEDWAADSDATFALMRAAHERFWNVVTEVALRLRAEDVIRQTFGRDLPILVQDLNWDESSHEATRRANPDGQADPFFAWLKGISQT